MKGLKELKLLVSNENQSRQVWRSGVVMKRRLCSPYLPAFFVCQEREVKKL
jgi:hypothetical protein